MQFDSAYSLMEAIWTTSIFTTEEDYKELMLSCLQQKQNMASFPVYSCGQRIMCILKKCKPVYKNGLF